MILVLLGTQNNSFYRLLNEIEKNIQNGNITEEVIVQAGFTKYSSNRMKILNLMSQENLKDLVKKADLIITHAGVGSLKMALEQNKKVITVPRLKKYHEHVNNHQIEIEQEFNKNGWVIGIEDVSELRNALKKFKNFIPIKYKNNNEEKLINIIKTYIDKI